MNLRKSSTDLTLIGLIVLENLFLFYFFREHLLTQEINSLCYFLASFSFGIVLIYKFYNKPAVKPAIEKGKLKWNIYLFLALTAAAVIWMSTRTNNILKGIPIDVSYSDIIPAIQIAVHNFLSGEFAYKPLTSLGYTTPMGYMPLHWMPYIFAEIYHFDYRTITFTIFSIAGCLLMVRSIRNRIPVQWITLGLLTASYFLIIFQADDVIGVTVETMIAGYYMMMIMGLNMKNAFLQGMFLAFCILSRFTLLMWLPLWAFVLFVSSRKDFFKASLAIIVMVTGLYIIPFLSKDWTMFSKTIAFYSSNANEWKHVNESGVPYHLYNGIGFGYLFYEKYRPDFMQGFNLLRNVFFAVTAGSILLMGLWYWLKRFKIDRRIFLMASFKIYMSIFFAFIIVPYQYLMVTSIFVSIAIFAEQGKYRMGENEA